MTPPRFFADANVGKLARWLRLLGYDVRFVRDIDDRELAQLSRQEGRMILTTDRKLPEQQRISHAIVLDSFDVREQIRQVLDAFPLDPAQQPFTRCSRCNAPLAEVPKEGLADEVPPRSYAFYNRFYRCSGCAKLYWPGTHTDHMLHKLRSLRDGEG